MAPPPPLTAAELARITALVEEREHALADLETADTEHEHMTAYKFYHSSTDDLAEAVPALLTEVQRLRERLRWRTVATDGLPAAGERVLVRLREVTSRAWLLSLDRHSPHWVGHDCALAVRDTDRWLPEPTS